MSDAAQLIDRALETERDYRPALVSAAREAPAASPAEAAACGVIRSVFVGREAELRVLDDELARATAGEGRVVLVAGDEGAGKTSLALEASRLARRRGCTVLWGQCYEAAEAPAFWPWIEVLRRCVAAADLAALRQDLGASAAAVGWITPALRERLPDLPAPDTAEPTRFHVVDGVTQFLKRVAARHPLVLVLDDLHRADGDSLHLLRFLAAESADAPLLVLGAYHDGNAGGANAAELARVAVHPLTTLLRLGGFAVAEVRRYVEEATAVRPSEALAQAIHDKTGGHPLFVAQVTRLLAAEERLSEPPANDEFRLAIPASRRQAIAERLARRSDRPALRPAQERGLFRQAGDAWEVAFRGHHGTVPHRVGMTYLRCLLERPGIPLPAIQLASLGSDALLVDHAGGPMIDRKAMAAVQRRIAEIDADIAGCGRRNAIVSTEILQERAECEAYLRGRGTELVSSADRARSGVTKAIGRALKAIRRVHEGLAHHLERHVETGRLCVYVPDPAAPVTFEF